MYLGSLPGSYNVGPRCADVVRAGQAADIAATSMRRRLGGRFVFQGANLDLLSQVLGVSRQSLFARGGQEDDNLRQPA